VNFDIVIVVKQQRNILKEAHDDNYGRTEYSSEENANRNSG